MNAINKLKIYSYRLKAKSVLQTRPLKKIPERIVFQKGNTYQMSFLNGTILGRMKAEPIYEHRDGFYPINRPYASFYIKRLKSFFSGLGIGKDFIKIARKESFREFCSGRVHLVAFNSENLKKPPQIFYRKTGFTTTNKMHLKEIDRAISAGEQLKSDNWWSTQMYLPQTITKS